MEIILNDRIVARSKNLRGIDAYWKKSSLIASNATLEEDGRGMLRLLYQDGAHAEIPFESFAVLCDWLKRKRNGWQGIRQINGGRLF
jgi:hypothetical protein